MKRWLVSGIGIVVLVAVLVATACAAPKPTPTPLPTATPRPTPTVGPTATPAPTTAGPTATPRPSPTAGPTATPAPTTAGPTATPGKVFKWKAVYAGPKEGFPVTFDLSARIQQASGGRIQIEDLWGGMHPLGVGDYWPAMRDRVYELVYAAPVYVTSAEPLLGVFDLPGMSPTSEQHPPGL